MGKTFLDSRTMGTNLISKTPKDIAIKTETS
jgi:hypothetical protein